MLYGAIVRELIYEYVIDMIPAHLNSSCAWRRNGASRSGCFYGTTKYFLFNLGTWLLALGQKASCFLDGRKLSPTSTLSTLISAGISVAIWLWQYGYGSTVSSKQEAVDRNKPRGHSFIGYWCFYCVFALFSAWLLVASLCLIWAGNIWLPNHSEKVESIKISSLTFNKRSNFKRHSACYFLN